MAGIAKVAAGAWVHGRHENEARRERRRVERPRDGDVAFFQRLPQHFQAAAIELGQLVEEENAMVSQADLARRGRTAAADHAGVTDGVMWRTERPLSHQSGASGESGDRMNFC